MHNLIMANSLSDVDGHAMYFEAADKAFKGDVDTPFVMRLRRYHEEATGPTRSRRSATASSDPWPQPGCER